MTGQREPAGQHVVVIDVSKMAGSAAGAVRPRRSNDPWSWVARAAELVAAEAREGPCSPEALQHLQATIRVARGIETVPQQRRDGSGRLLVAERRLTFREEDALFMVAEGKSNAQIGRTWVVSEDTVKSHLTRLFAKIGALNRAHAVTLGFRSGVLH